MRSRGVMAILCVAVAGRLTRWASRSRGENYAASLSGNTVQALAGHSDLKTTQRYAHVVAVDLEEAIRRRRGNGVVTDEKTR